MTRGDRIRNLRESFGWTQEKLAKRAGYETKSAICKIETAGDNVTFKTAERLAPVFNVTPAYIMGWDGNEPSFLEQEHVPEKDNDKIIMDFAKPSREDAERRMLLYLYEMLNAENKAALVAKMQEMLTEQKGGIL